MIHFREVSYDIYEIYNNEHVRVPFATRILQRFQQNNSTAENVIHKIKIHHS